ncbi:hypothetical protein NL676_034139 [Syzygium grande]|nr:hypothetical protein NL676_034139 [Syzygium grande]
MIGTDRTVEPSDAQVPSPKSSGPCAPRGINSGSAGLRARMNAPMLAGVNMERSVCARRRTDHLPGNHDGHFYQSWKLTTTRPDEGGGVGRSLIKRDRSPSKVDLLHLHLLSSYIVPRRRRRRRRTPAPALPPSSLSWAETKMAVLSMKHPSSSSSSSSSSSVAEAKYH